jgi:hypothetical protein
MKTVVFHYRYCHYTKDTEIIPMGTRDKGVHSFHLPSAFHPAYINRSNIPVDRMTNSLKGTTGVHVTQELQ